MAYLDDDLPCVIRKKVEVWAELLGAMPILLLMSEVSCNDYHVCSVNFIVMIDVSDRVPSWMTRVGAEGFCNNDEVFSVDYSVAIDVRTV